MSWLNFKVIMLNEKKDTKGYTLYDSVYMSFYKRQCPVPGRNRVGGGLGRGGGAGG